MTTLFIVLGILFVIGIVYLGIKWFKSEPKTNVGNNGGVIPDAPGNHQASELLDVKVADNILFGKAGVLEKKETFYEGKIKKNSQLYLRLSVSMKGDAVLCGVNDNVSKPKLQIAVQLDDKQDIGNPSNSQRQSVEPYVIHNGNSVWLSTNILDGVTLPEYLVLRILSRLDNGNGYGEWKINDAINIHITK